MRLLTVLLLAALASTSASGQGTEVPTLVAKNYEYDPPRLEVAPGTHVRVRSEGEAHTVTPAKAGDFEGSGLVQAGEEGSFVAPTTPGEYRYYCELHALPDDPPGETMTGLLVVKAASATPSGSAASGDGGQQETPGMGPLALLAALAVLACVRRR